MTSRLSNRMLAFVVAIVLVLVASLLVDFEGCPDSIRIVMSWILMPGIVTIGLFFPSESFLATILFVIGFYVVVIALIQAVSSRFARRFK